MFSLRPGASRQPDAFPGVCQALTVVGRNHAYTSSTGAEVWFEQPELQHGAFTKALLDAFDDPTADVNRNGLITPNGLATYVANHVPMLTGDKQHPGMEVRYDTTLFARSR